MKYASGEHAEVGDLIEVVDSKDTSYAFPLQVGTRQTVVKQGDGCVWLAGKDAWGFWASRFKLIKRQEPKVLPSPVRVQWPEQEQLKMDDLSRGDWFVFVDAPQVPCVAFSVGQHIQIVGTKEYPAWTLLTTCYGMCKKPVRRLKNPLPEKYEVI